MGTLVDDLVSPLDFGIILEKDELPPFVGFVTHDLCETRNAVVQVVEVIDQGPAHHDDASAI